MIYRIGGRVRVEQTSAPNESGRVMVHLMFDTEAEACGCVLSFGPEVEIIEPVVLRERVVNLASSVLQFYGSEAVGTYRREPGVARAGRRLP